MTEKIYTIDEIREKVAPIFKRANVKRAILFGSYAKGTAGEKSDIDIYIDSEGALRGFKFFGVYDEVEEELDKKVDLIPEISEEYRKCNLKIPEIYSEIFSTGVALYGEK